eukprot:1177414-Prorocentrum_minimum.AAC.1
MKAHRMNNRDFPTVTDLVNRYHIPRDFFIHNKNPGTNIANYHHVKGVVYWNLKDQGVNVAFNKYDWKNFEQNPIQWTYCSTSAAARLQAAHQETQDDLLDDPVK